jgi:RNA polymerase sigma-70 factor (ECF subfamily)
MKFYIPEEIIKPFNQGDPEAFARIYHEFYPFIYSYVHKRIFASPSTADIVADSFTKLLQKRGSFKNLRIVKSYLFQTAKNGCLDYLKHARLEREKALVIEKREQALREDIFDPFESQGELLTMIFKQIEKLPRKCRQIFMLYYTDCLTITEIANRLGISEKTVSNQKTIAIKILKMKLTKMNTLSMPIFIAASFHLGGLLHVRF